MSEKIQAGPEYQAVNEAGAEVFENKEEQRPTSETAPNKEEKLDSIENIKQSIERNAVSAKETAHLKESEETVHPTYLTREIKSEALSHTLKRVRRQLSPLNRGLSKVTHNKAVNALSEAGSKTVARPSGILGGGLAACLGSLTIILMARHYGFRYNYTIFVLLFVVGFSGGIAIEIAWRIGQRLKRKL